MTVFNVGEAGVADLPLAELLRAAGRAAAEDSGSRQPGKVVSGMANALDPSTGVLLGSVGGMEGLHYHARVAVGDVLAAGIVQAGQHPAAERLSAVAAKWAQFTAEAAA